MPEKVHDCVKSVLDDNPEMEESGAWAICQAEMQADAGGIEVNTLDDLTGIQAADMDDLAAESDWAGDDGVWWHEDEQLVVYDPSAAPGADQQAAEFAADIFRIVQPEDSGMDLDGDVMGVGVDMPNAGVYVDWKIKAWPEDEQLDEAHVSDYGSVGDLEQATGGEVEHLETVEADVAGADPDRQADLPVECRACGKNDRMDGSMVCSECDDAEQQADDGHVLGPATNGVSYRLEDSEVYCEAEGEVFDQSEASQGVCPHCGEPFGPDQQLVTITGLSQEAITHIERRYNADVSVVDGEASAAPTDHESSAE